MTRVPEGPRGTGEASATGGLCHRHRRRNRSPRKSRASWLAAHGSYRNRYPGGVPGAPAKAMCRNLGDWDSCAHNRGPRTRPAHRLNVFKRLHKLQLEQTVQDGARSDNQPANGLSNGRAAWNWNSRAKSSRQGNSRNPTQPSQLAPSACRSRALSVPWALGPTGCQEQPYRVAGVDYERLVAERTASRRLRKLKKQGCLDEEPAPARHRQDRHSPGTRRHRGPWSGAALPARPLRDPGLEHNSPGELFGSRPRPHPSPQWCCCSAKQQARLRCPASGLR